MEQHKEPTTKIVLEASTSDKLTARHLMDHGFEMHMANPRKMSEINKSYKKTDRNDTRILMKKLKDLSGEIFMEWRKKHPLKGKDHQCDIHYKLEEINNILREKYALEHPREERDWRTYEQDIHIPFHSNRESSCY